MTTIAAREHARAAETLEELWRFNVGTGFSAAPMSYAVNGKQYVAIASGGCCVQPSR